MKNIKYWQKTRQLKCEKYKVSDITIPTLLTIQIKSTCSLFLFEKRIYMLTPNCISPICL